MPRIDHPVGGVSRYLVAGIVATGASLGAIAIFAAALTEFAIAHFWEPLIQRFGVFGSTVPFALIAFASGLAVGAGVGLVLGDRSARITQLAGLLAGIIWLSGAVTYLGDGSPRWSSVVAAAMLAGGLIVGGAFTRHVRHA